MTDRRVLSVSLVLPTLGIASLIGICSWLAIDLTRPPGGVTIVWVASGLLTGILLTSPRRLWPAYLIAALIGTLVARAACGDAWLIIFGRGVASTFEAFFVAYAVSRFAGDATDPAKVLQVARVAIGSTLLACVLSGAVAAATSIFADASFRGIFIAWFASHTLGMTIFATLVVVARQQGTLLMGPRGRRWKFARSMLLLATTTLWVFSQSRYPMLFLVYPPLLFVVFRHRFNGVVIGIGVVMLVSVTATVIGTGPLFLVQGASAQERILLLQLFIAVACLLALPVAMVMAERSRLTATLRDREQGYRLLADYSSDLVVRLRADGRRLYVSPSVKQMLGWQPCELMEPRWDLVHPEDRTRLIDAMQALFQTGNETIIVYRALHKNGHYVWIEALARKVESDGSGDTAEIIYSGRDISKRIAAEHSLAESERRIRAITDNLPAMVMRVDTEQRYTFANTYLHKIFGFEPGSLIGRTMREVVTPELYAGISAHIEAALRGEHVTFEGAIEANGRRYYRQANYIPDFNTEGKVTGFYSLTYDISELQATKQELVRVAQHDPLTGLGNRNKFNERLNLALAKARRNAHPIALIYLDVDYFKQVNDTFGHAVGDAVLCVFARRLEQSVRETDLAVRLGGDEFAVLIEDIASRDVPEIIARKLVEAMQPALLVQGIELTVTASIGVGFCLSETSADSLMQFADTALYDAKAAGRNAYRIAVVD